MSCVRALNLQKCVLSLCSCEYVHSLSVCVCLVACFVIADSAYTYTYNNLLYCTRFDSFICTDVR